MKITKKQLNKIKMIVCDLDGTLLTIKKKYHQLQSLI